VIFQRAEGIDQGWQACGRRLSRRISNFNELLWMAQTYATRKLGEGDGTRDSDDCRSPLAPAHQLAAVDRLEDRVSPAPHGVILIQQSERGQLTRKKIVHGEVVERRGA